MFFNPLKINSEKLKNKFNLHKHFDVEVKMNKNN